MTAGLEAHLAERSVIVVVGRGGVGKTTVAAALGMQAAQRHGRRVLVVTVDPARRLADALGVYGLDGEAVLVPIGAGTGRLWVLMVEMSRAWDQLVRHCAPDDTTAEDLLANSLYRSLTTRFTASHDYVALDHLLLLDDGRFDLIIVDTPPGNHVADLFAAPGRLKQFFDSRLLRWLTAGVGGGVTRLASRPFQLVARRLLGGDFLDRISELFTIFSRLRPELVRRVDAVEQLIGSAKTAMVEVRAAGSDRLGERVQPDVDVLVLNRLLPMTAMEFAENGVLRLVPTLDDGVVEELQDDSLRAAVVGLVAATPPMEIDVDPDVSLVLSPELVGGVTSLAELQALADRMTVKR